MDERHINCHFNIYIMSMFSQPASSRSLVPREFRANASEVEERMDEASEASQVNVQLMGYIDNSARDYLEDFQTKRKLQKVSFSKQRNFAEQNMVGSQLMYNSHLIPEDNQERNWECIRKIEQYNLQQNELERHQRKRQQDRKKLIFQISNCIEALRQIKPRTQKIHQQLANKYKQMIRQLHAGYRFWQEKCLSRQKSIIIKFKQLKNVLEAYNREKIYYLDQYNKILVENDALHKEIDTQKRQKEKLREQKYTIQEQYKIAMEQIEQKKQLMCKILQDVQETIKRVDQIDIQHHDRLEKNKKIKEQMAIIIKNIQGHKVLIKQKDIEIILIKRKVTKQKQEKERKSC